MPFSSDSDRSRGRGRDRDQSAPSDSGRGRKGGGGCGIEQLFSCHISCNLFIFLSSSLPQGHRRVHLFLTVFGGVLLECIAKSVCCTKFLPQGKLSLVQHLCQLLENFFEDYN